MAISIREQILAVFCTAVGGSYALDTPDDDRDLPVTAVQDGEETAEADYSCSQITLPVVVARAETTTSREADAMRTQCNAILAALISEVKASSALDALIDSVFYQSGFIQAEAGKYCMAQAAFTIQYHTVLGDPFNIEEAED